MDSSANATPGHSPTSHGPAQRAFDDGPLKQGLAALAHRQYDTAIALLQAALEGDPPDKIAGRARVGLVKAYQRQGNLPQAIACCQPLLASPYPPARDWGRRALAALQTSTPAESKAASETAPETGTGFVPLDPNSDAEDPRAIASPAPAQHPARHPEPRPSAPEPATAAAAGADDESNAESDAASPSQRQSRVSQQQSPRRDGRIRRPTEALPWRRAERAQRWTPLADTPSFEQGIVSLWTLASLVVLASGLLQMVMALGNPVRRIVTRYIFLPRWQFLENHPTAIVAIALLLLWAASPWLLQAVLQRQGAKPLSSQRLSHISPESGRLLQRQRLQPRLYMLPTQAPVLISFGLHPRFAWLVVSEGLRQLSDDEVATLVAAELSYLQSPSTACLTLAVAVSQLPYVLYWTLATWGDRRSVGLLRGLASAGAALFYGLFWLSRWPSLWLSRWRRWQGDRSAVSLTGNPNALARALVTVSAAMAAERRRHPELGGLLDGVAPLLPVSPEAALPLGYLAQQPLSDTEFYGELGQRLQWPCPPAYRRWLTLNRTHPPLDERLRSLMAMAAGWRLTPEIPRLEPPNDALSSSDLRLQTAPYWAALVGVGVALLLWAVGAIAGRQSPLGWLWGDRAILYGLTAIGSSMGLLARINRYFPDVPATRTAAPEETDLVALRQSRGAPVQSEPVVLQGKLLGSRGLHNALGQDLLLDTRDGLIRLSYTSTLGPVGNLFLGQPPYKLIGRTVTVAGWFHRGATAWVDIHRISASGKRPYAANHPVWSTLVAIALALWGAWTIYRGGA